MDKQSLIALFNYHYWANRRLWRSVVALSEKQFTQPLGDGSSPIRTQIVRMVANENLWVDYLWHGEVEFLQESDIPTRARIRQEWDALEEEMRDFIDELTPGQLESQVEPAFLNTGASLKVWEILLHIVNDAIASRAQLRLHLDRLGSPPAAHDFIDFLVERNSPPRPVAVWAAPHAWLGA
jgi:uncharacterized damage-inducible protein DinB